jgi:hypothetical protein
VDVVRAKFEQMLVKRVLYDLHPGRDGPWAQDSARREVLTDGVVEIAEVARVDSVHDNDLAGVYRQAVLSEVACYVASP